MGFPPLVSNCWMLRPTDSVPSVARNGEIPTPAMRMAWSRYGIAICPPTIRTDRCPRSTPKFPPPPLLWVVPAVSTTGSIIGPLPGIKGARIFSLDPVDDAMDCIGLEQFLVSDQFDFGSELPQNIDLVLTDRIAKVKFRTVSPRGRDRRNSDARIAAGEIEKKIARLQSAAVSIGEIRVGLRQFDDQAEKFRQCQAEATKFSREAQPGKAGLFQNIIIIETKLAAKIMSYGVSADIGPPEISQLSCRSVCWARNPRPGWHWSLQIPVCRATWRNSSRAYAAAASTPCSKSCR